MSENNASASGSSVTARSTTTTGDAPGTLDISGEFEAGNRKARSGINQAQNRAVGQDDPIAEGSRQGRERYRSTPAESQAERENIPPV